MAFMMLHEIIWLLLCSHVFILECKITAAGHRGREVRKFPDGFQFGSATSSYQIEGAWNRDGKTENIWDRFTHECRAMNCSNGDEAAKSYDLFRRDVQMTRELGLDFYRFSVSWNRILPTSFADKINQAGAAYYNKLINELLKYNIQPMLTIFHWDLPQKLQEMGGWTNPNIVDWFGDYARTVYELFGDRVKLFITINEPQQICYDGYGSQYMAPGLNIKGVAEYLCSKNLLLAHARAYHIYDKEFRASQRGSVFITLSAQWHEPDSEKDVMAAEEANQFELGQYSHPIFSKIGDYPPIMKKIIATKSAQQGLSRSRLPAFTPEEVKYVRGTSDFFGLNHYFTYYVLRNKSVNDFYDVPSTEDDLGVFKYQKSEWKIGQSDFTKRVPAPTPFKLKHNSKELLYSRNRCGGGTDPIEPEKVLPPLNCCIYVPWGFYKLLTKIREDYDNPPVYVTENGFATHGGLQDDDRITYYLNYIDAMLDAMDEGSDIRIYTAWSLMDNFEWFFGYTEKFGLYEVDFDSPERTRTPRKSAFVYKNILRTRALDMHYEPDTTVMTIDDGH